MIKTALIDSDIVAWRAAILAETEDLDEVMNLVRRIHHSWTDMAGCDGYVCCLSHGPPIRRAYWPDYKMNRKDRPKPRHLHDVMTELKATENSAYHEGWEADDVLGFLGTHPDAEDVVIVSVDKDLDQIPGMHCNPDKEIIYEVSDDDADMYRWMQVLSGDSTDGYPGIPKIGQVKARRILEDVQHGDRQRVVEETYVAKDLTLDMCARMTGCATIITYSKEIQCALLSPDSTADSTLPRFLRSLMQSDG